MAVRTRAEENALILDAFAKYRVAFVAKSEPRNLAPYRHFGLRDSIPILWAAYHEMVQDHATGAANELNHFSHHIAQLAAWSEVLPDYEIQDQLVLLMEFVTPIATTATNLPYAIRARLVYSAAHLSHQANLITDSSYSESALPPDDKISYKSLKKVAVSWKSFTAFSSSLLALCDKEYERGTFEFRTKYNHRQPPRFEHGHTGTVTRDFCKDGRVSYGFGYTEPLKLPVLLPLLRAQHDAGRKAFDLYSELVREQLCAIYR